MDQQTYAFWDMNYFLLFSVKSRQTDGQTESDAYEPTVQCAQVGSKTMLQVYHHNAPNRSTAHLGMYNIVACKWGFNLTCGSHLGPPYT